MAIAKYKPSIDLGHIGELHALDRLLQERGETDGIRPHITEMIRRLTDGNKLVKAGPNDPRVSQAKKLWDLGFGRELKYSKFDDYLATIPAIPASLLANNPEFPLLVLVDPRLGYVVSCRLAGLKFAEYGYGDKALKPCDKHHTIPTTAPYWIRAHDGTPNLGRKPSECLAECTGKRFAGTADVGIAIYVQHGKYNHSMDLPGSVHRGGSCCACLGVWRDGPELCVSRDVTAGPRFGSVVFVRE